MDPTGHANNRFVLYFWSPKIDCVFLHIDPVPGDTSNFTILGTSIEQQNNQIIVILTLFTAI